MVTRGRDYEGDNGTRSGRAPSSGHGLPVSLSPSLSGSTAADRSLIALIGARGCGKTTVARLLAERLGWGWVDADDELERRAGQSVRAVFAAEGEIGFRRREDAILRELCGRQRHVLATGGGAVLREDNRALLRSSARVVWLIADAETLWRRLEGDGMTAERRPQLAGGGRAEVEEVLRQREALYRACADCEISTAGRSPDEVAAEIAAGLLARGPFPNSSPD